MFNGAQSGTQNCRSTHRKRNFNDTLPDGKSFDFFSAGKGETAKVGLIKDIMKEKSQRFRNGASRRNKNAGFADVFGFHNRENRNGERHL